MGERIILIIVSLLCGIPFYFIGAFGKTSRTPMSFWSGDSSLKYKVKNVEKYNLEMGKIYQRYGLVYIIVAVAVLMSPIIGLILLFTNTIIGICIVYKQYKQILEKYSH